MRGFFPTGAQIFFPRPAGLCLAQKHGRHGPRPFLWRGNPTAKFPPAGEQGFARFFTPDFGGRPSTRHRSIFNSSLVRGIIVRPGWAGPSQHGSFGFPGFVREGTVLFFGKDFISRADRSFGGSHSGEFFCTNKKKKPFPPGPSVIFFYIYYI